MTDLRACKILAVDDTETNIDLLLDALGDDFDVRVAMNGQEALEDIQEEPPDLVLLDIMMPEMDGYEVCEKLKADDSTMDIPVIFLTAMNKDLDEAKGLSLGAVDYVTKPFNPELVKARVRNQLELKLQRDELKKQNQILLEIAQLKADIERITQHDLKGPLNGIINFPALVLNGENLTENQKSYLDKTIKLGRKMLMMINLSLDLYKMESKTYKLSPVPVNVLAIINDILAENAVMIDSDELVINITIDGQPADENSDFTVNGEELLFYSMLSNTIKNAIEASDDEDTITISLAQSGSKTINVHNQGVVPEDIRDTFFEKYATSGKSSGTGLGTYSAKLIAETQGGSVSLQTSEADGTSIIFHFPD